MLAVDLISQCAGSYEGPIASFPSDAAGQAEATQTAAVTPTARPQSRFANVSCVLPPFKPFPPPPPFPLPPSHGLQVLFERKEKHSAHTLMPTSSVHANPQPLNFLLCGLSVQL